MKYLVWIITIFLNVTGHHFLPNEARRSRASLNNYTGYEISAEESHNESVSIINQFVELNKKVQMQQQATLDEYEITLENFRLLLAKKDDEIKSLKRSQDACITRNITVNCTWSDWSDCSVTCGPGFKSRMVTEKAMFGGKPCEGLNKTTCNLQDCPHGSVILVAGGGVGAEDQDYSQVLDVSSTRSCSSLQPYPHKMRYATGGIIDGRPVICGGFGGPGVASNSADMQVQSSCYNYDMSSNAWKLHTNMNNIRYLLSSAVVNGGLWVTGGHTGGSNGNLASTEFIFSNELVINGPNLPATRIRHCMVTLNDGRVMILGGYPSAKSVQIFNPEDDTFTTGPTLLYNKDDAGCTLFMSPMHQNRPVVLAVGGWDQSNAEVLDYTIANAWEKIGSLPTTHDSRFYGARVLPSLSGDGAYLQFKQYLYELTCTSSSCNWSIMEQQLTHSVQAAVMMYLPYGYNC